MGVKGSLKRFGKWFNHVQWLNVLTLIFQVVNNSKQIVPGLETSQWVMATQGVLAAVLPSLNGVAHAAVYGEEQNPEHR